MQDTWIGGQLKSFYTCIQNLEPEIKDLKALDNEELRKLAKSEEVQSLDANMCNLEGQLEFERGAMIELHEIYKDVKNSLAFFNKAKGNKVVPLPSIIC